MYGNSVLEGNVDKNARWRYINMVQTEKWPELKKKLSAMSKSRKTEEWWQMEDPECRESRSGLECISLRCSPSWAWSSRCSGVNSVIPPPTLRCDMLVWRNKVILHIVKHEKGGEENTQNNEMRTGKENPYNVGLN